MLGYKTYHMQHVMKNKGHVEEWLGVLKGEKELSEVADTVFTELGYTATVDFPSITYWQDLALLYPNAMIILTERSTPEEWWESASQTILIPGILTRVLFTVSPFWRRFGELLTYLWFKTFDFDRPRHVSLEDRDQAIDAYVRNSAIARAFDEDRVLVYQVSQGWEPLCTFLNKPIPDAPFPNINSLKDFQKHMFKNFLLFMAPSASIATMIVYWMKRRSSGRSTGNNVKQA